MRGMTCSTLHRGYDAFLTNYCKSCVKRLLFSLFQVLFPNKYLSSTNIVTIDVTRSLSELKPVLTTH